MLVDRSKFLLMATMLATTTAACEREPDHTRAPAPASPPAVATPSVTPQVGPVPVDIVEPGAAGTPACDDLQGVPEECPSVGPSDEGVCPNVIQKRCSEFKAAMKPRVAAQAVACLRALKANERCDVARINLCGHQALMSACSEPAKAKKGELHAATATAPARVVMTPESTADTSPLSSACSAILKACGERPLSPSLADCKQTLAGMTESGRSGMVECVSQHCSDRGLLGCEAAPKAQAANAR